MTESKYDLVPDLAALIDGLREAFSDPATPIASITKMFLGPYARLRRGLLLDEPGWDDVSTEESIREALHCLNPGTEAGK